jgi:Protein of unknown function (DUF4236)
VGWRFRHSFKVIPGVRLNLSKSGLSASIGTAPFTVNVGPRGVYGTASLPGSGISYRHRLGGTAPDQPEIPSPPLPAPSSFPSIVPPPALPAVPGPSLIPTMPIQEVHSASTELLTSESLKEIKKVLQTTYEEHEDISRQLVSARQEKETANRRFQSWESGFLFKKIFKQKFAKRKDESETADAKVAELGEQLRLTTIATHVDIAKEQAEPYFKMRDDFAALCECEAVWDIKSYQTTDKFHERTTAETRVDRQRVAFSLGACDLLQWDRKVPHMQNEKGGDLFLYPGFILYRASRQAFSVIDFHDVNGNCNLVKFQEEQGVPKDSKVIGQTWAKANKDGSRDKRFVNNYQIPIVAYASLSLKSNSGLWEEFQFSNVERVAQFLQSWNKFVGSFDASSPKPN